MEQFKNTGQISTVCEPVKKKKSPRCLVCRKKVGLLGFTCQCSETSVFCASHRQPEDHDCHFDRKTIQKEILAHKLVKVTNNKIIKI